MRRPTRATAAGQAYLDLQNRARAEGRATQELLTLYVVERWLARLSTSPYTDQRQYDAGGLTADQLERTRRELAASLALARPGSPARAPIQAQIAAIDAELAGRDTRPA